MWAAAPGRFLVTAALELTAGLAIAVEVLAGRAAITALLEAERFGVGARHVFPQLAVLGLLVGYRRASASVLNNQLTVLGLQVIRRADNQILDVATAVELEAFENPTFLDRLERSTDNAGRPMEIVQGLLGMAGTVFGLLGLTWAIVTIQPLLLPLLALAGLPLWFSSVRSARDAFATESSLAEAVRRRRYLRRVLTGKEEAKELRAFGTTGVLRRLFDQAYDAWLVEQRALLRRRLFRSLKASAVASLMTAAAGAALVLLLIGDHIGLASAAAAAYAIRQMRGRVEGFVAGAGKLYQSGLYLDDLRTFVAMTPALASRVPKGAVTAPFERLVLDEVSFAYPGTERVVLDQVSIEIGAGEVVALVGESGSGKTTLAKLLCHLYRPVSGSIRWDGVETADVDPDSVRTWTAPVFQDFARYQLSASQNIALGRASSSHDEEGMIAAARRAGAHPFLAGLPSGYQTVLSRAFAGGHELSVGQWQRVALARALFRDAPFVVLDEPAAALDARAEHDLFENARELCAGRAVLLISHRFSTVRSADRIYVMADGRVVEQGTHDELMAAGALYAELFTLQASAYA